MADLRTLLYTDAVIQTIPALQEFLVANITESPDNGGRCCLWTVPVGTTYIKFEMWGGGGGGGGGCCCMQGYAGGSGSYTVKTLSGAEVVPGCQYTICAGGSTGSAPSNNGCIGCTSYVTGYNLSSFCARGGCGSCTGCYGFYQCYVCTMNFYTCCSNGGDYNIPATCGGRIASQYCQMNGQQWIPVAPATVSGPLFGPPGCSCSWCADTYMPWPVFPGGGGAAAQVYGGGCRCGFWGAPGAVSVTYG